MSMGREREGNSTGQCERSGLTGLSQFTHLSPELFLSFHACMHFPISQLTLPFRAPHLTLPCSSSTMLTTFDSCIWLTACPRCDDASTARLLTSPRSRIRFAWTSFRRS
jgi:hypothetical protein